MLYEKAHAKLNLNLHVLPHKLINGFYEVKFINCELDVHDELEFENIEGKIEIISDSQGLPKTHQNLIYKAGILLKESTGNKKLGARITLNKNIPIKAGFGGGSSDAASAIRGLIKLWNLKLDKKSILDIAGKLGKDVFYFLEGGVCEVRGDGREIRKLNLVLPAFWLIIIVPDIKKPSTAWMYQHLDSNKIGQHLKRFKQFIKGQNIHNLHNDFETTALQHFPVIKQIKKDLEKNGALKSLLAGSGLSMVGFYKNQVERNMAFEKLRGVYKNIFCTKTK